MAPQTATSSIAIALAGKTASMDIPKPRTVFPSGSTNCSSRPGQLAMLPTPPNSISPGLPPQAFNRQPGAISPVSPPLAATHVDSDIDLQDSRDHRHQQQPPQDLDSAGAITPGMLAKYHLPDILLQQGPLAIRHVMGYLTTSVPGFSRIPPAKARRIVVAALEGKGGNNGAGTEEAGGLDGEVIFEKVGWGRWDARRRGEPLRDRQHMQSSPPSSISNSFQQPGLQIPGMSPWAMKRGSISTTYGTSMAGDSAIFSHSEEMDYGPHEDVSMLEHEADKMSLDGDERGYCSSEAPDDDVVQEGEWDEGDVTDEEDWAQIGADALRARSLTGGGGFVHTSLAARMEQQPLRLGSSSSTLVKSAPLHIPVQQFGFSLPDGLVGDTEERAAVEALLRLGSM
ncbi:hypothetical protein ASPZODRAFT_15119 [Penicilliopsis zonata CBS 506.65]|uniref:Sin3 binding protein n=1 Tax=Penicilliopsis zonata CBS 506.65 TaxID=1073090 RepID=A0A1L9SKA7_9EURO|nr:hypothetical protein ASPZODRAFT_15119 [Penicilliopsis zonata CBS 506.65]OJJ47669.1 hypothetical protein ASPZODRAFT_15119 [Penicilliopsis zonata CBS 506.65]